MKILFLEIDNEREWAVASIGPAFIAAYVRAHGHQAELLRIPLEMSAAEASAAIRARVPLCGMSPSFFAAASGTSMWRFIEPLVSSTKQTLRLKKRRP